MRSIDELSPDAMRALVAELEREATRRREEKLARGEFATGPTIIAGHPRSAQRMQDELTATMRKAGELREILFDWIITGVPRLSRGEDAENWPRSPI